MLKRVQHDKKKYVIPNLFRNLGFWNDNELIAFVIVLKKILLPLDGGGLRWALNHVRFRTSHAPYVVHGVDKMYFPLTLTLSHQGRGRG
jgi:hypothetical protein